VLYIKTKNLHWHVSGPNFRDYHLRFDEQAR
jgi:starvation-inducible DNA-binding protein